MNRTKRKHEGKKLYNKIMHQVLNHNDKYLYHMKIKIFHENILIYPNHKR